MDNTNDMLVLLRKTPDDVVVRAFYLLLRSWPLGSGVACYYKKTEMNLSQSVDLVSIDTELFKDATAHVMLTDIVDALGEKCCFNPFQTPTGDFEMVVFGLGGYFSLWQSS